MYINTTNIVAMPVWWPDNIYLGIFFFFLGVFGAAILVYLGDWEKSLGKSARILKIEGEIASKRKIADEIKDPEKTETRKQWEDMINADEDRFDRERNFVRTYGIILYLCIGGVMAAILANSMVEAVAFGAGWTGFIGMFGIKKDADERRKIRDEIDEKDFEEFEKTLAEKTPDAYYSGYSDAIIKIAEIENTTVEEILKKLG